MKYIILGKRGIHNWRKYGLISHTCIGNTYVIKCDIINRYRSAIIQGKNKRIFDKMLRIIGKEYNLLNTSYIKNNGTHSTEMNIKKFEKMNKISKVKKRR